MRWLKNPIRFSNGSMSDANGNKSLRNVFVVHDKRYTGSAYPLIELGNWLEEQGLKSRQNEKI